MRPARVDPVDRIPLVDHAVTPSRSEAVAGPARVGDRAGTERAGRAPVCGDARPARRGLILGSGLSPACGGKAWGRGFP